MSSSLAGNGFDIGIEAEDGDHEGALPSLVTIAWENSDDIKSIANFFTLRRGAVAISEAQCITHKVRVTLFISAPTFQITYVVNYVIVEHQITIKILKQSTSLPEYQW